MAKQLIHLLTGLGLAVALTQAGPASGQSRYESNARTAKEYLGTITARQAGNPRETARGAPRIVGGQIVGEDEFRDLGYVASLQFDGQHFCGASFVQPLFGVLPDGEEVVTGWGAAGSQAPRMAITAAHCVFDADGRVSSTEFLTVRSESRRLSDTTATVQQVLQIVAHHGFDDDLNNDIAVLILGAPAGPDLGRVATLVLPTLIDADAYQHSNVPLRVAGWGSFAEGGPISDDLRSVRVPYANQAACRDSHGRIGVAVNSGAFCAGFRTGGFDSCQGDSGGALVFQHRTPGGDAVRAPVLAGVVSWGIGCARYGLQGIYTDTLRHTAWLEAVALAFIDDLDP